MAAKTFLDGKSRLIVLLGVGVLAVAVGVGVYMFSGPGDGSVPPPPSSVVNARAPVATGAANSPSSQLYDSLLEKQNQQSAAEAARSGQSAVPVLRTGTEQATPTAVDSQSSKVQTVPRPANEQAQPIVEDQRLRAAAVDREKAITERKAQMAAQLKLLQANWSVAGHSSQNILPPGPAVQAAVSSAGAQATPAGEATSVGNLPSGGSSAVGSVVAHMGDTAVARLDTPINTDSPLPMYKATIVQDGPLNGAVLLGTVQANTQNTYGAGVPFTFTQMLLPGQAPQAVSAYAINAEDAGALQGEVNSHVFQRYTAAFGSGFLNGVSQGLMQGGRQQNVVTSTNGYAVQTDAFTNGQLVVLGLAGAGQIAATGLQRDISRPRTISIPGGTTIGVFFTADVAAPTTK